MIGSTKLFDLTTRIGRRWYWFLVFNTVLALLLTVGALNGWFNGDGVSAAQRLRSVITPLSVFLLLGSLLLGVRASARPLQIVAHILMAAALLLILYSVWLTL